MNNEPVLHELIHQIGNGDSLAIEALYDKMRRPLLRYLQNRFVPPLEDDDLEDIVQFTFIQIFLHASSYRGVHDEASARKWMFGIARNRAFRTVEVAGRTVSFTSLEKDLSDGDEDERRLFAAQLVSPENTEEQAFDELLIQEIRTYIETLPERERKIMINRMEKSTLAEIGRNVRLTKPRINQILNGILRDMRRHFGPDQF